ncbi:MAG: 5-formyltetrahydrofolate cyclo-ligase [Myxococcales bacterium]|nr:5-formyltetrahydrofolate cyclo-ligase [Myxococcota bacterium]MDW8284256.1 5-formyltetrahydrofolate cyclo-ligase [Myxococcales bacterium]
MKPEASARADDRLWAEKWTLRAALRAQRDHLAPPAGSQEALKAATQAARWILAELHRARRVALYRACGHEFDPAPLGAEAARRGATLAYPRVVGLRPPTLAFHAVDDPARLRPGRFGVPEPDAGEPLVDDPDIFIVPGLAFDRQGHRLGYGAGFYDTALRACPGALRIAPCHAFQIVAAVPFSDQDEPVDVIVTPEGAHWTGARAPVSSRGQQEEG